jgi:hypothetical protein
MKTAAFLFSDKKTGYRVFKNGITHAEDDGVEYAPNADGLSIAKAYCDYRAKMAKLDVHIPHKQYSPMQDTYGQSLCVSADCFGLGE